MKLFTRLIGLIKEDSGATAALVAVALTATIGLTATAIDMGVVYTAKSQVQNAADAAALAAANAMISYDANKKAVASTSSALSSATQYASANHALGVATALKSPPGSDFTIGYWNSSAHDFDPNRTGMGLSNPADITAVRVKVRRDEQANTPVSTYFARVMGIDQVPVAASSTAFLGYAASVPQGTVQLPIAVVAQDINTSCNPCVEKVFKLDAVAAWTSFFTNPNNATSVKDYLDGDRAIPNLKVGDGIYLNADSISNDYFGDSYNLVKNLYNANGVDTNHDHKAEYWVVTMPVVDSALYAANGSKLENAFAALWGVLTPAPAYACGATTRHQVKGFVTMKLTKINNNDHSQASGTLQCDMVIPNSATGGDNFGSRATASKLVK